ncbi:hypothetical protein [Streptomyces tailanensis]|uniref:hypothetical protein n=1 Tax=Streptomyces tailanensis TaxID=2569858 RepID=UPI00122E3932|nr:hypothetical protein [Streptomyces tailanensis]
MTVEIDDWTCRVDFPEGWIQLMAASGETGWARAAVNSLNPSDLVVSAESFEQGLISPAREAEQIQSVLSAAFFVAGGAHYATFTVQIFGEDGVTLSLDEVEDRLRGHKEMVGEPGVSRVDLSAGPAIRLQARYQSKGVFGFGKKLWESVSYALLVPQTSDVLLATTAWNASKHRQQLAAEADALMKTLRHVLLDAEGNPISDPGSTT